MQLPLHPSPDFCTSFCSQIPFSFRQKIHILPSHPLHSLHLPARALPSLQSPLTAPLADYHTYEDADEETQKHLQKEIAEAEKHGWAEGKPGSFLNRLIAHGNKKTEEELRRGKTSEGSASSSSSS